MSLKGSRTYWLAMVSGDKLFWAPSWGKADFEKQLQEWALDQGIANCSAKFIINTHSKLAPTIWQS